MDSNDDGTKNRTSVEDGLSLYYRFWNTTMQLRSGRLSSFSSTGFRQAAT